LIGLRLVSKPNEQSVLSQKKPVTTVEAVLSLRNINIIFLLTIVDISINSMYDIILVFTIFK